jgi:hypothetical protein
MRGMGLNGRAPNPDGKLHKHPITQVAMRRGTHKLIPEPPQLSKENLEFWHSYWTSDLARAANPKTDIQAVKRLFTLYEERDQLYALYKDSDLFKPLPKTRAAKQKPVRWGSPIRALLGKIHQEIIQLEDRFGLSPISRLRLGLTAANAANVFSQINNLETDVSSDSTEPEIDPRETEEFHPA